MTKYELLLAGKSLLELCAKNGIQPSDVKYLELYQEYNRLKSEGHKNTFITYYLSEQFGVSEISIYRIAKRFAEVVEI